jgi:PAS domain S-box-containing protein
MVEKNRLMLMVESISKSSTGVLAGLTSKAAMKVLHVDDDVNYLKIAEQCLKMQGRFQVDTARSVEEAMEMMKKETYDAIISDYQMPGKDGLEFLKELREKGNGIPFVIFTGKGREEIAIKALNLSADGYFSKHGEPETVYGELAHGIRLAVEGKRAETEIWRREERLRAVLASSPDAIVISDLNGNVVDCNEATLRLTGYSSKEEIVGRSSFKFMAERDREKALKNLKRTLEHGIVKNVEYTCLKKNGAEYLGELSASVLKDSVGNPVGFVGAIRDITERKRVEDALRQSKESFESLAENAFDGLLVGTQGGVHVYANKRAAEITGYTVAELLRTTIKELAHPDESEKMLERYRRRIEGRAVPNPCETVIIAKDGRSVPIELAGARTIWQRNPADLVFFRDITERKKMENTLRENERKYRVLVENIPQKIFIKDKNSVYVSCNENYARDLKIKSNEIMGKTDYDFFAEELAEKYRADDKRIMESEETQDIEEEYIQNGQKVYVHTVKTPVKDENDNVVGVLGIFWDITEHKKAEEALRNSEEIWRSLAESSPDHIMLLDLKGNILYINRTVPDLKREQVIGTSHFDYIPPEWHRVAKDCFKRVIETGKTDHYTTEYRTKDDEVRYFDARIGPVFQEDRVVALISSSTDVTSQKKTGEKLRESEQKFRCLVEEAAAYVGIIDLKGQFTYVNKALADSLGYSVQELTGRPFKDFLHPDDRGKITRLFLKSILLRRKPQSLEFRVIRKDGHVLQWMAKPTASAIEGKTVGFQAIITDITESKKAEVELRNTKNYLDNLLNYANAPIIVWDNAKRITLFNNAFEALTGHKKESMLGRNIDILFPPLQKEEILQTIEDATKGEKWKSVEIPILCKDKKTKIALWNSASITDEEGKTVATIAQGQDITERRKAEELVRASEERYRSYIEVTGQLGWTTNANGEVEEDIPAWRKFTGQSHEEVKGWAWTKALHPDDLEHTTQAWEKAVATKSTYEAEYRIRRYDGVYRHFLAHGVPVFDEDGSIREWVGTCIDITERRKAEQMLEESEEKYRSLVELAPDGIVAVNAEGIVTSANRSFLTLLGYDFEEVVGKPFTELKTSRVEDIPKFQEMFSSLMNGEPLSPVEFLYVRRDGTSRWAEVHPSLLIKDGNPVGAQVIMRDVSERKNAEKLIQENQQKFEQLFMSNPEAAVYVDPNERVLNVNPHFTELFGYSFDEVKEKFLDDFVVPEDRKKEAIMLAQKGKEGYVYYETVRKNKKGSLIPVTLSTAPIMLQGQHLGDIVLYKDITERKQWEDALRDAKEKWASLTENTDDIVMVVDGNGVIQYINRTIPPYTPEETVGKTMYEYVPREQHDVFEKSLREVFKTGEPDSYQVSSSIPKIGTMWFSTKVVPIKHDGKVSAAILISSNITDRKKAEEELCRAMKKLDVMNEKLRVVGGLTRHDVNNKLTAVAGYTYLARNRLPGNSEVLDYLKQIEASIEQTVKIFDFAKAYETLGVEELVHVDVEKSVKEAISLVSGLKDIKVINDCHGLTVLADSLLKTLFYNLIDNSLKYGEKLSQIGVYYEEKNSDHLNLIYEDDGVGVPHAVKPRLFDEGYSTGKGSGYGLYLIKRMMEVYGWTIQETGMPGKGAQFTITIPKTNPNGKENYLLDRES